MLTGQEDEINVLDGEQQLEQPRNSNHNLYRFYMRLSRHKRLARELNPVQD